jgi:hypothetical protein
MQFKNVNFNGESIVARKLNLVHFCFENCDTRIQKQTM